MLVKANLHEVLLVHWMEMPSAICISGVIADIHIGGKETSNDKKDVAKHCIVIKKNKKDYFSNNLGGS